MRQVFAFPRISSFLAILTLTTLSSVASAQSDAGLKIHDLGRIAQENAVPEIANQPDSPARARPPRSIVIQARRLAGAKRDDSQPLARITPRDMYHSMVSASFSCMSGPHFMTTAAENNIWRCKTVPTDGSYMQFFFRQLKANSKYLVTISLQVEELDVRVGDSKQTTKIEKPGSPLFLAFETGAGQETATIMLSRLLGITSGNLGHLTMFYGLELEEIR